MTPGSFANRFKQFIALVGRSGVTDSARIVLRELGIRTPQSMAYPGLDRRFVVEFDPVWRWIGKGLREPGLLRFAQDRVARGCTVFDIGAHVGESALLMSELVGATGVVVAFEPDPTARASLKKNLATNGITNVRVEEKCVSDRLGKVILTTERFGSGLSSIVRPPAEGASYNRVEVESTTLDDYCESNHLFPDWIKIDAEGAEPLVVRGMRRLIQTKHPSVMLEFHSDGLTEAQKREAWSVATERATSIEFLQSRRKDHKYLEKLAKDYVPDCGFLIVYVRY